VPPSLRACRSRPQFVASEVFVRERDDGFHERSRIGGFGGAQSSMRADVEISGFRGRHGIYSSDHKCAEIEIVWRIDTDADAQLKLLKVR